MSSACADDPPPVDHANPEQMPDNLIDKPQAVREGEQLDTARLLSYLCSQGLAIDGPLVVEQFPSGYSNLTYLLRAGDTELVLRRPPLGAKIKTAHDMGREYLILTHVWPVYGKVPRPILYCDDAAVLGAPFFMMQRVKGLILRSRIPKDLELAPSFMRKLSKAFLQNLIEIHSIDYLAAHLEKLGQPEGYVARQIAGWTRRYYDARTDDVPSIEKLASWLAEHQPAESNRASLIHNDYKYDNVVLDPNQPDQVLATLDWEMATIGDPLMDLGTTLGYWVDADDSDEWQRYGFGLTKLPGSLSRADLIQTYAQRTGADVTEIVFYYAYGLMKIAVIVQQIYHRYRSGLTRDPRFADLGGLVNACGNLAQQAIEKRRIDRLG